MIRSTATEPAVDPVIVEIRKMAAAARYNPDGTPLLSGDSLTAMSRLYVLLPRLLAELEKVVK